MLSRLYKKVLPLTLVLFSAPGFVLAAPKDFKEVVALFLDILSRVVPVIFSLALLYFFFGVAKYIYSAGDTKKAEEGRMTMLWGIIGFFVMVCIFGILKVLERTFL